jgi:two-component system response regulator GlrR
VEGDRETEQRDWRRERTGYVEARHTFRVLSGPQAGRTHVIDSAHARIGAAPDNEIVLTAPTVSRKHCEVVVRDGRARIRDLGSTNGTQVDGVMVVEAFLDEEGARILVGDVELEYRGLTQWHDAEEAASTSFGELLGRSAVMRRVFTVLARVAPTPLTCLLIGETGTGKELAARALHDASERRDHPFVVVDCGAIAATLIESELFGHERGAFTGADRARAGAFELAHQGTIFLDEIGELPLDLQSRLLRALERREVRRIGARQSIDVDLRVVAATHRDIDDMVAAGTFREDLYFRLAEVIVHLPSLEERAEDIAFLADELLARLEGPPKRLSPEARALLTAHPWPGNVRELRNVIRRAAAFTAGPTIDASALELRAPRADPAARRQSMATPNEGAVAIEVRDDLAVGAARAAWARDLERIYLERIRARFGDDIDAAAAHMALHRKSVYRLLRDHQLIDEEAIERVVRLRRERDG